MVLQQHWDFCRDQREGIVVVTVLYSLLLLHGCCNNRSHSSPAGPCSRLGYCIWKDRWGVNSCICISTCVCQDCEFVLCVCGLARLVWSHWIFYSPVGTSRGWSRPWWRHYGTTLGSPFIYSHACSVASIDPPLREDKDKKDMQQAKHARSYAT